MSLGQTIRNSVDTALQDRERRFNDPAFRRELALEQQRFVESLGAMGNRALDTAVATTLIPLGPLWHSLEMASKGRFRVGEVFAQAARRTVDAGVKTTQFVAAALVAGGRGVKLGIRAALAV